MNFAFEFEIKETWKEVLPKAPLKVTFVTLQFPLVAFNKISWYAQFACSNISCNFILTNTKIAEQLAAGENYTCN